MDRHRITEHCITNRPRKEACLSFTERVSVLKWIPMLFTKMVILSVFLLGFSQNGMAQEKYSISPNTTYFFDGRLDRFYFSDDHTFMQQFTYDWDQYPKGTILTGTWTDNGPQTCLHYASLKDPYCFDISKDNGDIYFKDGDRVAFHFSEYKTGDWLLSDDGITTLNIARFYEDGTMPYNNDEELGNYLKNKSFTDHELSYVFKDDGRLYDLQKNQYTGYWSIENSAIIIRDLNHEFLYSRFITFGTEFKSPKKKQLYVYTGLNDIVAEDDGSFTLETIEKDI